MGTDAVRIWSPVREGTSLLEKYVDVACVQKTDACGMLQATEDSSETGFIVTNGIRYRYTESVDVAAGSIFTRRRYAAVHEGKCVEFILVLHSTHPENHSPPLAPFDEDRESMVMDMILRTLQFASQ